MSNDNRDFVKRSSIALNNNVLQCPNCGSEYLHQEQIRVYTRELEDKPTSVLAICAQSGVTEKLYINGDIPPLGNPSRRRDGIRIFFSCEGCDASVHLTIAQHKGNTNIEMECVEHGRFSAVEWP